MRQDPRAFGTRLAPATQPEPKKISLTGSAVNDGTAEAGTAHEPTADPKVGIWLTRFRQWRDEFNRLIAPRTRKYWRAYRNFDDYPAYGPGMEWRDRTVIPSPFKWIETALPREVMAQYSGREFFTVEPVEADDAEYSEKCRTLIQTSLDLIGSDEADCRPYIAREIEGARYRSIVGHCWWKVWWRESTRHLKTKVKDADGKWQNVQGWEQLYSNVDVDWLPLDALAVDLNPVCRRWAIERVLTSLEALQEENKKYRDQNGEDLYPGLADMDLIGFGATGSQENGEEPRNTEAWPMDPPNRRWADPGETPVEMWLCWDNKRGTLTKLANRRWVLDEGLAPTPDGLDPYIADPCLKLPGQIYGDSLLNWSLSLANNQTVIARARVDEVMLSIFQQFFYREGSITSNKFLLRPGGAIGIESNDPTKPIGADFGILPRRDVLPSVWQEEGYRQQQGESVMAADPVSQGVEATQKSRDVSATEVQQRVLQGSGRYQLTNLYREVAVKKPKLQKIWNLLRQNLTTPRIIRVLGRGSEAVDLTHLEAPIDIKVGGGIYELTKANRGQDLQLLIQLVGAPFFQGVFKPLGVANAVLDQMDWKDKNSILNTAEQVTSGQQAAAMANAMGKGAGASDPEALATQAGTLGAMPSMPGEGQPTGVQGESPEPSPESSGDGIEL